MTFPVIIGFIIGFFIPAIAGRFGKILPADPGRIILSLWHKPHFPKVLSRKKKLIDLWIEFLLASVVWGLIVALLFGLNSVLMPKSLSAWGYPFIALICFCILIDFKYYLLPDFFTIPLLILGFSMATFSSVLTPTDSIFGAAFGYLTAFLSTVVLGKRQKAELGLGDIKMMAAIGSWLGVLGLNFTLMLSFFFFAISVTVQKKKQDAYGPALGTAAIIAFFLIYSI